MLQKNISQTLYFLEEEELELLLELELLQLLEDATGDIWAQSP